MCGLSPELVHAEGLHLFREPAGVADLFLPVRRLCPFEHLRERSDHGHDRRAAGGAPEAFNLLRLMGRGLLEHGRRIGLVHAHDAHRARRGHGLVPAARDEVRAEGFAVERHAADGIGAVDDDWDFVIVGQLRDPFASGYVPVAAVRVGEQRQRRGLPGLGLYLFDGGGKACGRDPVFRAPAFSGPS